MADIYTMFSLAVPFTDPNEAKRAFKDASAVLEVLESDLEPNEILPERLRPLAEDCDGPAYLHLSRHKEHLVVYYTDGYGEVDFAIELLIFFQREYPSCPRRIALEWAETCPGEFGGGVALLLDGSVHEIIRTSEIARRFTSNEES